MSKIYEYNKYMEEIDCLMEEQTEFREKFIDELLLENFDLKQENKGLREQIKFLMQSTRRL